jgi:flap endonuclease-1
MGIKQLNQLLKNQCPQIFREVSLYEFAFQKVAIDVSLFMCKFKSISENWLSSFLNLITCLRKHNIHCVFIFDNGHPPEKIQEKEDRSQLREKNKARVDALESSLVKYETTDILDDNLQEIYYKQEGEKVIPKDQKVKLLRSIIDKKKKAIFTITPDDWLHLRNLFHVMNVVYYDAPLEAETMCADLCKRGLVSAALSEDTDVLAYGSTIFLTKIDIYRGTAVKIEFAEILSALALTENQFLDLCIMCGTDYNKNIPKVGCETAYKFISQFGSIEEIGKQKNLDISILKHEKSRELFTKYERYDFSTETIPYNGTPDYEKVYDLFCSLDLEKTISIDQIKNCYKPKITFV